MSEKNPVRKNRRVLKQVSLDESRAEPVWPNFSESIRPRDEITKTHSILKTGDSRGLYEMTEIDSPTKTNRRLETMSPKQKKISVHTKRREWARVKRQIESKDSKSSTQSSNSNRTETGIPEDPVEQSDVKVVGSERKKSAGVHGSFKSWFGGVKWARKVLLDLDAEGESEEDEPPLTAYTRRLKMMHEKGPFDDIQDDDWKKQWRRRGQRRTFGVFYFSLAVFVSVCISVFILLGLFPSPPSQTATRGTLPSHGNSRNG
ncbi:uncharacterized protein LOC134845025 [Symsagittifera roscoffensis]|uniref:uncharacterized protein LOC134845025 n=1 Tax=Symsagittifera roscoffensis TaxID=84072 RepID=UPI00307B465F